MGVLRRARANSWDGHGLGGQGWRMEQERITVEVQLPRQAMELMTVISMLEAADVETLASAIVSKARFTNGKGSASSTFFGIESSVRSSSSFVPPPAGIMPTPTSTNPI